jgi:hypothetical protein
MVQQKRCQVPTSGPAGNNDRTRNAVFHAPRNVSGQHEKEIDSLGSAAGGPSCWRYQPNDQEGPHSAHYVGTVLLCSSSWDCCPSCRKECSWCLACLYFTTRTWPDGGAHGEQKPPRAFLLFVGWGWGQQRRSSACAIIACSRLSHGLPRLATN